jgi:HTH-type transcriptional repressor of NAD biosynthesis genes
MIKGLVVGGFRPFHKGHEALIDYAKSKCDSLIIFVADPPDWIIPYKYRLNWVSSQYLHDPQIEVYGDVVKEPLFLSSDEKSRWWGEFINRKFGKIDRVFSSEKYGKTFSESLGAENWVFNESRSIIPVSATLIRNKPLTHWNYINNFAKDYFVKKICIVGTESTGKTTLSQQLAGYYKTSWVHEVGRDIFPDTASGSIEDIKLIGLKHAESIIRNTRISNKLLFIDTDLSITKSYSQYLFGEIPDFPKWVEKANEMDLYIYLMPDTPYIQDGTRLDKEQRDNLHLNHLNFFNRENSDYFKMVPFGKSYLDRFGRIAKIINEFVDRY